MNKTVEQIISKNVNFDLNSRDWDAPIDFDDVSRCYDWKNYVGDFKDVWYSLTTREKQIVYIMCKKLADKEEWD